MTLNEAYRIPRRYHDWRIGYDCRTLEQNELSPKLISEAISKILDEAGISVPFATCIMCKHRGGNIDTGNFCSLNARGECDQFERSGGGGK